MPRTCETENERGTVRRQETNNTIDYYTNSTDKNKPPARWRERQAAHSPGGILADDAQPYYSIFRDFLHLFYGGCIMKITKTKTGKYTAVVSIGKDQTGKQHTKRFTADSRQELKDAVTEYKSAHKVYKESHVFSDALQRYIDARRPHRSPSTIRGYVSIQETLKAQHGTFCALSTGDIQDKDLQKVVDSMRLAGKSEKTIRNVVGLIGAVLTEDGFQRPRLILPARKVQDNPIPSIGEIRMILCLAHGTRLEIPLQLSLLGMRRGEVCALDPSDIDADGIVHIHKSMIYSEDAVWIVNDVPKTSASNRFVQLPPWVAEQIGANGVTSMTPANYSDTFRRFLIKYRFPPYRLHDCRHFFASYCHAQGISEADILAAGGWRTGSVMRKVYRHAMSKNAAGSAITAALNL